MITGISHIEMRSRCFDESREIYGTHLGLTEIQNTTAVLNEKSEWESVVSKTFGDRKAIFQVGDSFLIIQEDLEAPIELSVDGRPTREPSGSVAHWSFFVEGNHHAYSHWKNFLDVYRFTATSDGPSVQPMNHQYLQRSLLEFYDPSGHPIQTSEIVDPRSEKQKRRREKQGIASLANGTVIKGFDHIRMHCPDMRKGKEMYVDKLGLTIIEHRETEINDLYALSAGLCDIELNFKKDGSNSSQFGRGVVGSFGFWSDDVDALAKQIQHHSHSRKRDLTLGVPVKSITLDVGDGFPVEVSQRL